jgi:hypothetical protein
MKNVIMLVILCLIVDSALAQKVIEKHMDFSQKQSLALDIQIADSICIHTWNKKEVFAKALVDVNDNTDNDAYHVNFDEAGNILKVTAKFDDKYFSRKHNFTSKIAWDIYVPENTGFSVKTIDGNIIINGNTADINARTISGNIIITGSTAEIKAHTISGFVDLTVPSGVKADLDFKTISGTIYSNHEVAFLPKKKAGTTKISDQINGGGTRINLETISGDIYFRKM